MEIKEERKEREIRVFDLFISLCQRWRSLLICLVIGAVVLGAYGWYKSAPATPPEPQTAAEEEKAWEEILGPDEIKAVEQVLDSMKEYEALRKELDSFTEMEKKIENLSRLTNIQNSIASVRGFLSEDQKGYLAYLQGDESIIPGDKDSYDRSTKKEEEEYTGRHISKKWIVVGAFLGFLIAALLIIIKYVASTTVKTAGETEENLGMPVIGRFDGSSKFYAKRKTALDRWLRRVKQKNKQRPDCAESIDLVTTRLQIAAEKDNMKKVCLVVDPNVDLERMQNNDFLNEIARVRTLLYGVVRRHDDHRRRIRL